MHKLIICGKACNIWTRRSNPHLWKSLNSKRRSQIHVLYPKLAIFYVLLCGHFPAWKSALWTFLTFLMSESSFLLNLSILVCLYLLTDSLSLFTLIVFYENKQLLQNQYFQECWKVSFLLILGGLKAELWWSKHVIKWFFSLALHTKFHKYKGNFLSDLYSIYWCIHFYFGSYSSWTAFLKSRAVERHPSW